MYRQRDLELVALPKSPAYGKSCIIPSVRLIALRSNLQHHEPWERKGCHDTKGLDVCRDDFFRLVGIEVLDGNG
jgi:hypothetical protein